MSVDTLIDNAESRALYWSSVADMAVSDLNHFLEGMDGQAAATSELVPAPVFDGAWPSYQNPGPISVPTLTPSANAVSAPQAFSPEQIGGIDNPYFSSAPYIDTSGLFTEQKPSVNLPDFKESEPNIIVDQLVAEMGAIPVPQLENIVFPAISEFSIGAAPALNIPAYAAPALPDTLQDPSDYAASFDAKYHQMLPEMQSFIDDKTSAFVSKFAPEYNSWTTQLQDKISASMNGSVLPDQFEAAMYTRARGRVEREFDATEQGLLESFSKSGFIDPPGTLVSGMLTTRLKGAAALADQSTDIYIERRKTEVQFLQFALNLASVQIQGVRSNVVAYVQVLNMNLQQAASFANTFAEKIEKFYDHLIARSQLRIAIVNAISTQYETKLKASLSALEGYRLELEAEKTKTSVEIAKLNAVETKVKAEELYIQRYSAMIDAITRKGSLEELKLKGYSIRADVFKARTQATVAGFEVYKASIDGDRAKLEGELAKIKLYEAEIQAKSVQIDAQAKRISAQATSNSAKASVYEAQTRAYATGAEIALQTLTQNAELKKLEASIKGQQISAATEVFKSQTSGIVSKNTMILEEYTQQMAAKIKEMEIAIQRLAIRERGAADFLQASASIAASAVGSLNSMVSSATSA